MLYSKYPFIGDLARISKIMLGEEMGVIELLDLVPEGIERAKDLVEAAVGKKKSVKECDDLCSVLSYKLAVLVAAALEDKWFQNKLAAFISEDAYKKFKNDEDGLKVAVMILRRMGYDVEVLTKPLTVTIRVHRGTEVPEIYPIKIHLNSYVSMAKRFLSDVHWKVVNKMLIGGYVYLRPEEILRLAQEAVYKKVLDDISSLGKVNVEELPDQIKEILKSITSEVRKSVSKRKRVETYVKGLVPEALPPCISSIYQRALNGANLSHQERFTLATFLLNVGMSVDEVLEVFSRAPDFNEKIARYQVEHLAGLRGSGKKYSPPSCRTLVSWNLCPSSDECEAKHPLSEYKRRIRLLRKRSKGRNRGDSGEGNAQSSEGGVGGVQRMDGGAG